MNTTANTNLRGSALIVGGGIGGMQAALDLADSGIRVHLVQRESSIGGTMAMLDKTFPTGDCAMCMISPRMVAVGRHANIDMHVLAEVLQVEGQAGDFSVRVRQHPRYVDPVRCTGCGVCEKKCPKFVVSRFEQGLVKRKAIYSLLNQAVPNTRVIDHANCLFFQRGRCKACEKFCDAGAVNFEDQAKDLNLRVGAVILSPGLRRYDPGNRPELGFGRWPNVVSSIQFERILSASGPYMGELKRPLDDKHPRRIAWIQCVGSRDPHNANPWCSSVCCMAATKQAVIAKEHDGAVEPTIFYMDLRAFGKDFDRYVERARAEYGVRYQRAMVSAVHEEAGSGNLILAYQETDGRLQEEIFDLVVLAVGMQPHADALDFARLFDLKPGAYGFAGTRGLQSVETSRAGVYVTGAYQEPKDIPETVVQGSAVAGRTLALIGGARGTEVTVKELPPEREVAPQAERIGVWVCHCGINISQTVDVQQVADAVRDLPDVAHAEDLLYACAQDGQERIKQLVQEKNLDRVVVASCTPRTHEALFQETIQEAGLNKYLFELADIREQCSWCHMGQKAAATVKATDIVRMAVAKTRLLEAVDTDSVEINHSALVIGGGMAGITTALAIGDQGHAVHLVECSGALGGRTRERFQTLQGDDVQAYLAAKIDALQAHERISLHLKTEVEKTDGFVGNFETLLTDGSRFTHGAVVIATGGVEYDPTEYAYGHSEAIITQSRLEQRLADPAADLPRHCVMIQCVGSREEPHNYCSRACCQDALKNAIAIKERSPEAAVTILYRDMRSYGLREDYYRQARDLGVLFVRFEPERKPEVIVREGALKVTAFDYVLNREIAFDPDLVVLSVATRPHPSAEKIGKLYKLTRNPDGFFLEAHVKLRPVDFPGEGIFVAGVAHAPKTLDETIGQALAAAGRAGVLLSRERLSVSGVISKHDRERCMSCLACYRACPFGVPFIDEDGKISHNQVQCTGCGICAGVCPAKAYQVNSFRDDQIVAMIDAV